MDISERLLGNIKHSLVLFENTPCWLWTKGLNHNGYAVVGQRIENKKVSVRAHRLAYTLWVGPILEGMHIDHRCQNRNCINPAHLEQVTPAENARRGRLLHVPDHCPQKHKFTPENTWVWNGRRRCKECKRIAKRAYRARLREEPEQSVSTTVIPGDLEEWMKKKEGVGNNFHQPAKKLRYQV